MSGADSGAEPAYWIDRPFAVSLFQRIATLCGVEMTDAQAGLFIKAMAYSMKAPPENMPEFEAANYELKTIEE